jgi:hypothetical protein
MPKRKVFISYYHRGEQAIVNDFIQTFKEDYEVFIDKSMERATDSEDTEYLNQACQEAIDGTSVTIVMIGKQTGRRKFVDWEIKHTLYRKHALIGISRTGLIDSIACLPKRLEDNLKSGSGYAKWYRYPSSASFLKNIIDEAYEADTEKIDNSREKME